MLLLLLWYRLQYFAKVKYCLYNFCIMLIYDKDKNLPTFSMCRGWLVSTRVCMWMSVFGKPGWVWNNACSGVWTWRYVLLQRKICVLQNKVTKDKVSIGFNHICFVTLLVFYRKKKKTIFFRKLIRNRVILQI